ncbi:YebC/PmpR family DNA-binding transcriptional regulator [Kyrpidia spormannii]|uniref:Factor regulating gene expression n=2 Tax=Kyrpidia spormannii TaxID=2055160 RepID=A0ACA8ZBG3_9BACL|nr:YebC/PmpR family DNA-binding transcriptional regulator [Kyrpidia spormannii]CAB3393517.1 putative factor regulating gene expression [Kyrpidia spormannii]CAB3394439.1 putative factor regulating gene expression [Kyrpidia spormannii]
MSGHSKWHNIQRRKGKQDAVRGQLFTKMSREIYAAARQGGSNPETNYRLKTAIERARAANMPMDSIQRTIDKAAGNVEGVNYEEMFYEGYGPGGAAVMVQLLTDNRNRTAAEIRHIFSKRGGSLGESGCVAWMFDRKGVIEISREGFPGSEDDAMMAALEAGAEDFTAEEDRYVITVAPEQLREVRENLEKSGVPIAGAEVTFVPQTTVNLEGDEAQRMVDLLEALEEHDDVQNVFSNVDLSDEDLV